MALKIGKVLTQAVIIGLLVAILVLLVQGRGSSTAVGKGRSGKAGLLFPVGRIGRFLRKMC